MLLIISKEEYEICKYSFSCLKEQLDNFCLLKLKTNAPDIFDVILNNEFNNSLSCDVNNVLNSETVKNIYYKPKPIKLLKPSYINGSCENNSQCLFGICQNSKCIYFSKCFSHEHCPLNTFCFKDNNTCLPFLKDNISCSNSYECEFNSYCDKKEKICKKLFSLEDGKYLNTIKGDYKNFEEICQSGGYYKDNYNNIYCQTLYNMNYKCDDDICKYKNSKGIIYNRDSNCLCGYNRYRKKYCVLGNGEKEYIDYLKIRKDFLFNENYIKKCHTLERDSKEICNELINTEESVSFRKYIQKYNNLKINALEYHRIKDSESCIKNIVFGYDTNPIIPFKQKCPKYSCNSSLPICLLGNNPFTESGDNIQITLNSEICSINENCILLESNIKQDFLQIMSKERIIGTCSINSNWTGFRYPGEHCNIDSDCINNKCKNERCFGFDEGDNCTQTYECSVGLFCNKDIMKCSKQKQEGGTCKEGWDCQNYLGCYRGRCYKLGILKPGVSNNMKTSPGNNRIDLLCTTGEMDWVLGYCVETKYNEIWIKNFNKKVDNNGFIACDYNEDCHYDNGKRTFTKKCGCGYNKDGQGYCPLPTNQRKEKWNERIKNIANIAKNDCHSLSRYNCYLKNTLEDINSKKKYDSETINAHLFYNAVPCAEKMFSEYKYNKVNFFLILLFFILNN